jgi:hypothetical protein
MTTAPVAPQAASWLTRTFPTAAPKAATVAHFFDHPATIAHAYKRVPWVYPTGFGLLLGWDVWKAPTWEDKKKVFVRDTMVLGATWAGTRWATKRFMPADQNVFGEIKESLPGLFKAIGEAKDNAIRKLAPEGSILKILQTPFEAQEDLSGKQVRALYKFAQDRLKIAAQEGPEAMSKFVRALEDALPLAEKKMKELETTLGKLEDLLAKRNLEMPKTPEALASFWKQVKAAKLPLAEEERVLVRNYIEGLSATFKQLEKEAKAGSAEAKAQLASMEAHLKTNGIHPLEKSEFWEEISEAREFFTVGFFSVLSGVMGGLAANQVIQSGRETRINIFKEAAFQFIANIALCAVGAIIGLTTANTLGVQNRLARFGIISAGLSLGICGGGYIANFLGRTLINPVCDWVESGERSLGALKERLHDGWVNKGRNRKIEFSDVILHLDDMPTALAIAGMKIFGPFIPPFFAFSGYRSGIGYRNIHQDADTAQQPQDMVSFGHLYNNTGTPLRLQAQNSVFQTFYRERPEESLYTLDPRWGSGHR